MHPFLRDAVRTVLTLLLLLACAMIGVGGVLVLQHLYG
jgi:hypothetical protein